MACSPERGESASGAEGSCGRRQFVRQLENYGRSGDLALTMSVSGNSPNCVKALAWARRSGLVTVALLGASRGRLADHADHVVRVNDTHFGRVEDAHMTICHLLCYLFMEAPGLAPA